MVFMKVFIGYMLGIFFINLRRLNEGFLNKLKILNYKKIFIILVKKYFYEINFKDF